MLLFATGCGDNPNAFSVSGKVTYQGKPIEQGTINFRSADGKLFGGGLQAGGDYEFDLPPGDYQVRVDAPEPMPSDWKEGDPLPTGKKRLAPMRYANFDSSGLTINVTQDADSRNFDFELR